MHWYLLALAVAANVATNVLLKKTMASIDVPLGPELIRQAALSPWLWASFAAGGTLLASYVLALRTVDLSISYALVTSAALVGITAASALVFGEPLSALKIAGIALIVSGIALVSR